jgi:hypothetical protein
MFRDGAEKEVLEVTDSPDRFGNSFPWLHWLITHPVRLFHAMCIVVLISSYYSLHIAYMLMSFCYVIGSYYIDRKYLNRILLPPLSVIAVFEFVRNGVGPMLYLIGNEGWSESILKMQQYHVIGFPLIVVGYWYFNRDSNITFGIFSGDVSYKEFILKMKILSLLLLVIITVVFFVGSVMGTMDRGRAGEAILENTNTLRSVFDAFSRFFDLAFLLFPVLFVGSGKAAKYILFGLLILFNIFFFATGTRGFILFSWLYLLIGYWMTKGNTKLIKTGLLVTVIVVPILIPLMAAYRASESFYETKLVNVFDRLSTIKDIKESIQEYDVSMLSVIGETLIGVSDKLIYDKTPEDIPYSGWENIENLAYIWIPKIVYPEKPLLYDGDEIVKNYTDLEFFRSYATITFNADMFRRFGFIGVVIGNLLYGILYGSAIKLIVRMYNRSAFIGVVFILFIVGCFRSPPIGTLLTTLWIWLWELPKYFIAVGLMCLISTEIFRFIRHKRLVYL